MGKLRVGVIGLGFIGMGKHLPGLAANPDDCEIVAVCDFKADLCEKAIAKYAPNAYSTDDYTKLVNDPDIDVIHVCTWNVSHCQISCEAMEAGKHVMCEKPMAINGEEARQMLETAKKTGKKLTIGYQNRFRTDAQFLKRTIDAGELGEIYVAKGHAIRRRGVPTWGVFTDIEKQGGGPLIDIGTHALDLSLWYMDNYDVDTVVGNVFYKLGKKPGGNPGGNWDPDTFSTEDSAFGYITMKNGACVFLEAAWAINFQKGREAAVTLAGTEGGADIDVVDGGAYQATINKIVADEQITYAPKPATKFFSPGGSEDEYQRTARLEAASWLAAIKNDTDPLVLPEQACRVTEVLEAIYKSSETGEPVTF